MASFKCSSCGETAFGRYGYCPDCEEAARRMGQESDDASEPVSNDRLLEVWEDIPF